MSKPLVLVTGASKGIGLAVVKSLLEEHNVCVVALARSTTPELTQLIHTHPSSLLAISCDVTDESTQARAFSQARDTFGPVLDGLILNAGTLDPLTRTGDLTVSLDAWKHHFDVNFFSLVSALRVALPALRASPNTGRVIFISSGAATGGTPGWAPYNAGKAAMNSLARYSHFPTWPLSQPCPDDSPDRTLAKEEPTLVSLAIAPGKVDTAMQETLRDTGAPHMDASDLQMFLDAHRDGTLVQPSDVGYSLRGNKFTRSFSSVGTEYEVTKRIIKEAPDGLKNALTCPTASVLPMAQLRASAGGSTSPLSQLHASKIIDVHHHILLDAQKKVKNNTLVGWVTPPEHLPWRPSQAMSAMDMMGIQTAILSPPPLAITDRAEVRTMNNYLSQLRAAYPTRFGFLAGLPSLDDVQGSDALWRSQQTPPLDTRSLGVLCEIAFAVDNLNADGFALISSYGTGNAAKYVADDLFDPIWDELNRRHALVFLHGAQTPSSTPYPHPFLGLPISEVPNETFKAAAHLVVTGKKRRFPDIKIILAHLGGSTPFLAPRVAALSHYVGCPLSPDEILQDFKTFYYETALSSHPTTLAAIDAFIPMDHILFGSDYPAVSTATLRWYTKHLEDYYTSEPHKLDRILRDNALALFPRLQGADQNT